MQAGLYGHVVDVTHYTTNVFWVNDFNVSVTPAQNRVFSITQVTADDFPPIAAPERIVIELLEHVTQDALYGSGLHLIQNQGSPYVTPEHAQQVRVQLGKGVDYTCHREEHSGRIAATALKVDLQCVLDDRYGVIIGVGGHPLFPLNPATLLWACPDGIGSAAVGTPAFAALHACHVVHYSALGGRVRLAEPFRLVGLVAISPVVG